MLFSYRNNSAAVRSPPPKKHIILTPRLRVFDFKISPVQPIVMGKCICPSFIIQLLPMLVIVLNQFLQYFVESLCSSISYIKLAPCSRLHKPIV